MGILDDDGGVAPLTRRASGHAFREICFAWGSGFRRLGFGGSGVRAWDCKVQDGGFFA